MRNPFVGLRPFKSTEDELFFGRAKETSILRDLALTLPVLTVYAPSGTGKSSLINAGLIPAIRRSPAMIDITIADPELEPSEFVRNQLAGQDWSRGAELDGLPLAHLLEAHYEDTDRRVILVLDQFEERIKRSENLDALYADIARLANTRSEAATVIISIREDYLAGLDRLMRRVSGLLDAGYRVPPLSRAALAEAVFRPLPIVADDVTVEGSLVDAVLTDLEQQAPLAGSPERQIEPGYFQIVWHRLWEIGAQGPDAVLTLASYASEGGAAAILKSFVGRILSGLLPYEAALLQASLRYLVLPTGAKVALTVDDLLGLLQAGDLSPGFSGLLFPQKRQPGLTYATPSLEPEVKAAPRPEVAQILESLFEQLTRTDAPLFRRVWRGAREEFELLHDLLGVILIEWRRDYETRRFSSIRELRSIALSPPEAGPSIAEATRFIQEMGDNIDAGLWEAVSEPEPSATLRLTLALVNSPRWKLARKSVKHLNELLTLMRSLAQKLEPEAISNPDREVRRALQADMWEFAVTPPAPPYGPSSPGPLGLIFECGLAILAAGLSAALATWLAGMLSFLPNIEYMELSVGLAAVGAALLYLIGYGAARRGGAHVNPAAARSALWPMPNRRGVRFVSSGWRVPWQARLLRWATSASYFFIWWPVLFASFITASYLGAALFAALGWSATAGFNVGALFSGLLLAIAYGAACDL